MYGVDLVMYEVGQSQRQALTQGKNCHVAGGEVKIKMKKCHRGALYVAIHEYKSV